MNHTAAEQQNIDFVLEVKKHECLYNTGLPSYSRKTETDKAWDAVGKAVNMTGPAAKEKWRNLRVVFSRNMKTPAPGAKQRKPYYLLEYMQFVTPFIRVVTPRDIKIPTIDENFYNDLVKNAAKVKRKRPSSMDETNRHLIDFIKKKSNKNITNSYIFSNDTITSFLDSLHPELKEMNLQQFKLFKRRVLSLIDEITSSGNHSGESSD